MATYYIDPAGNDSTGDGSSGNPWLTINKAITASSSGDTIIVNDGTYTDVVSTGQYGYFALINGKNLTISGASLDATLSIFNLGGANTSLIIQNCDVVFNDITITNIVRSNRSAIWNHEWGNSTAGSVTFNRCIFSEITTDNNTFVNAGAFNGSAQSSAPALSMKFNNCLFKNITNVPNGFVFASGYGTPSTTRQTTLNNCTMFLENDINGVVQIDNSAKPFDLNNCIFYNDSGETINLGPATSVNVTWDYSCAYNFSQVPTGTGNITSDPLFIDAANDNFNLRPTSPCIKTGTII